MKMQEDKNSFRFQEVNQEISELLDQYLIKSRKRKSHVLKQQSPETIANKLCAEYNFTRGFDSIEAIKNFISTYLENTNHLWNL